MQMIEPIVTVHPIFYADRLRWEIREPRHYVAATLRELSVKLGSGYQIADYHPDGFGATFRKGPAPQRPHELIRRREFGGGGFRR